MSTQYDTGQTYQQYQDEIAAGPASLPLLNESYVNATVAHVAQSKALAGALASPTAQTPVSAPATITGATNSSTTVTFTAANSFVAGETVAVAGVTGFSTNNPNGEWVVLSSGLSSSQFEVVVALAPTGTYSSGGTARGVTSGAALPSVGINADVVGTYVTETTAPAGP